MLSTLTIYNLTIQPIPHASICFVSPESIHLLRHFIWILLAVATQQNISPVQPVLFTGHRGFIVNLTRYTGKYLAYGRCACTSGHSAIAGSKHQQ